MLLNKATLLLGAFVAVMLSGCGAKGELFNKFENPSQGNAMVYVYRPDKFAGGGVSYNAFANDGTEDKLIGDIKNGGYANAEVPANKEVEIWAKTESKASVTIDTQNGEIYCVRAGIGIGFLVGRPKLEKVDMQTCEAEIVNTKLAQ